MNLILLGAPGAGKGTQGEIIRERLDIPTISTGNILRAAIKDCTPTGLKAKSYIDAGTLVPDEVIIGIVDERLAQDDCKNGYILDGVPRTIAQAEALEGAGIEFDCVLDIEVPDEEIRHRMIGRRACPVCGATYHLEAAPPKREGVCDNCGSTLTLREDDKPETVLDRLKVYHAQTEPLKEFYAQRGVLKSVENQPTIEDTAKAIAAVLQLGVTMDYSIFLYHRYMEERARYDDVRDAMAQAIVAAFRSLSGSSRLSVSASSSMAPRMQ